MIAEPETGAQQYRGWLGGWLVEVVGWCRLRIALTLKNLRLSRVDNWGLEFFFGQNSGP